jgi:hypothetical protein
MYSLRELQSAFTQAIFFSGDCTGLTATQDAGARFAIYRNNVFSNYREALRSVYPVVEKLVGREFFDHVAGRYITKHASTSGDIGEYGERFPEFLASFPAAKHLVYLRDVARLEWLIHESCHAADYPQSGQLLDSVSPEGFEALNFVLHPACRLIASPYPVLHIWKANQDGAVEETIDVAEGGDWVLVARPAFEVELRAMTRGHFVMLARFAEGQSFGTAYLHALDADPDFDVAAFMRTHIAVRTLVDYRTVTSD